MDSLAYLGALEDEEEEDDDEIEAEGEASASAAAAPAAAAPPRVDFAALERAATYAKERVVFGRPIGQNQGVAHPLAKSWAELSAAELLAYKAAKLYDDGKECGAEANAAKYLGAEAGFTACESAVLAHGGMGYAKEYDVERYMREAMIARIAPVSREMILNFISERVLGLPKSY